MSDRRKDASDPRTDTRAPDLTARHDKDVHDKDADSCQAAHLREGLPARMILQGHLPIVATDATSPEAPEVVTGLEMLRRIQAKQTRAFTGEAHLLPESLEETLGLALTSQGLSLQASKIPLPYNHEKLPYAGRRLLTTFALVPEARVMASKIVGLEEDLDTASRAEALLVVLTMFTEVAAANRAQALDSAAKKIEAGLSRVESLLDNAQLAAGMRPAIDLRAKPAKEAQQTRAANRRRVAEIQAQQPASPPASGPAPGAGDAAVPPATPPPVTVPAAPARAAGRRPLKG